MNYKKVDRVPNINLTTETMLLLQYCTEKDLILERVMRYWDKARRRDARIEHPSIDDLDGINAACCKAMLENLDEEIKRYWRKVSANVKAAQSRCMQEVLSPLPEDAATGADSATNDLPHETGGQPEVTTRLPVVTTDQPQTTNINNNNNNNININNNNNNKTKTNNNNKNNQTKINTINIPPTKNEIKAYAGRVGLEVDTEKYYDQMVKQGWRDNKGEPITAWKAYLRTWAKLARPQAQAGVGARQYTQRRYTEAELEARTEEL